VPVSDTAPIQISLAWCAGRRSALVEDFVDAVARTTRHSHTPPAPKA
jgi:hypothetical protein